MSKIHLMITLALALVVAACGNKSNLEPMTTAQKTQFQTTLSALGRISSAVDFNHVADVPQSGSSDEASLTMKQMVRQAMQQGKCQVDKSNVPSLSEGLNPIDGGRATLPSSLNAHWIMTGQDCPLELNLTLASQGDANSGTAAFHLIYRVKDSQLLTLNDVDSIDISGTIKADGTNTNTTQNVEVALEGSIHSQHDGALGFYASVKAESDRPLSSNMSKMANITAEAKLGLRYADFTGEMSMEMKSSEGQQRPDVKFFLNSEEVSPEEFTAFTNPIFPKN
jgi:hypothetical protein